VCSEAVTNPLCPFCLATSVEAWLTLYPNLRKELLPKIRKYLRDIEDKMIDDATGCVKCNNNQVSVCPYCFTKFVIDQLEKLKTHNIILSEFFQFFNFDLSKQGYSKELENLEV
jgi:hypothetical protein